jgi:hypothetical protein
MSTLQDHAAAMLETIDAAESEKKHARLTPNDRALIFRLAAKGNVTQAEIAKAVGCDPSTVTRTLRLLDTRKEARAILESGAARLADTVVKTDDAGIALKALGKLDVVREDRDGSGDQVGTIIVIGARWEGFSGLKDGDRLTVREGLLPHDRPSLQVIRPLGYGTESTCLVPDDFAIDTVPPGVTVDEDAQALLNQRRTTIDVVAVQAETRPCVPAAPRSGSARVRRAAKHSDDAA